MPTQQQLDDYAKMLKAHLPPKAAEDLHKQAGATVGDFIQLFFEGREEEKKEGGDKTPQIVQNCISHLERVLISCYYLGVKNERERVEALLGIHQPHPTRN